MLKTIAGLQGVAVLSKDAQKKIGGGLCWALTPNGGITGFNYESGNLELARSYAQANGTRYCCDSCRTASWMQPYLQS